VRARVELFQVDDSEGDLGVGGLGLDDIDVDVDMGLLFCESVHTCPTPLPSPRSMPIRTKGPGSIPNPIYQPSDRITPFHPISNPPSPLNRIKEDKRSPKRPDQGNPRLRLTGQCSPF
jgi:hypothetical protein